MAKRQGWENLPTQVPTFVYQHFEDLRTRYGDKYGISPSQPLTVAALSYVATVESLKTALLAYREACKKRGIKHGL
jgi:hypothetical protein